MLAGMNERGQYGRQERFSQQPDGATDYGELGAVLGVGALIGIMIGSNLTFHSPVKKRQR